MEKQFEGLELKFEHSDRSPLLKDPTSSSKSEQILITQPSTSTLPSSKSTNVVLPQNPNIPITQNEVIFLGTFINI